MDHIAFLAIMRGIPEAFAYLDAQKIDRSVLWRLLGDPARRRSRERRLRR